MKSCLLRLLSEENVTLYNCIAVSHNYNTINQC